MGNARAILDTNTIKVIEADRFFVGVLAKMGVDFQHYSK